MDHPQATREFSRTRQAWYAQPPLDNGLYDNEEVMISYCDDKVSGEFAIRWKLVGGKPEAQLQAYDDSWCLLPHFADLFQEMAKLKPDVSVDVLCDCLKRLGIKDATPRQAPNSVSAYARALKSSG